MLQDDNRHPSNSAEVLAFVQVMLWRRCVPGPQDPGEYWGLTLHSSIALPPSTTVIPSVVSPSISGSPVEREEVRRAAETGKNEMIKSKE